MDLVGYLAAVVMGVVLGLVGGGGSILTVPILVYLLGVPPVEATAYSLFIVGLSGLIGAIRYIKLGLVDFRIGTLFTLPAFLGVYLVRRYGVPLVPDVIDLLFVSISKDSLILGVFSIVMLLASISMIRDRKSSDRNENVSAKSNLHWIALEGLLVGGVTGFVGAGGGFLIIPALVVLAGLEMKVAVGTSLLIIGIKSLLGFLGDLQVMSSIDWPLLARFTAFSILGIFGGTLISRYVSSERLKKSFGWFVLVMGGVIFIQQLL